ncbi:recombinase family protein [Streptacidiphilus sp. PAMC 29251]
MTEDTTSPEKQRESIEHWANVPGTDRKIVGHAEDLDISGGMDPFKRPQLGPWLTERADEFDVIAVWKLDRLTRRSAHFAQLHEWCEKNGKTIVSTTEAIDMSTAMGKMFAAIIAAFAEGELDTIRARAESGALARLRKGVWVGGVLPFGYQFQRQADGGKKLIQDRVYAPLLLDIVQRLKDDVSPYKIAVDLNKSGVLAWSDHLRVLKGEEPRGVKWVTGTILAILKNPTVGGLYRYKGRIVEDDQGNPVPITDEPILPYAQWAEIVAGLTSNRTTTRATPSRTMLGGVAICGSCGAKMSSAKKTKPNRVYHYYACNSLQTGTCSAPGRTRKEDLDGAVEKFIDEILGNKPVMEKVQDLSAETRTELDAAVARLKRLEDDFIAGRYDGEAQEESYWRLQGGVTAKVATLRTVLAEQQGGPEYVDTGKTYRQEWAGKDDDQKRVFLQRHGIEVKVSPLEGKGGAMVFLRATDLPGIGKAEGLQVSTGLFPDGIKMDVLPLRKRETAKAAQ